MIFNGLTQFSLASAILRLVLCGVMIAVAFTAVRRGPRTGSGEGAEVLVTLLALLIGCLALLSWPIYIATLQSYVDQWPETMCIYGVLHVGAGTSSGRWLPFLAEGIVWLKPFLALVLAAWCVSHFLNRSTREGRLKRTALTLVLGLGLLGGMDAALEGGYLLTPKREASPVPGCCVVQFSTTHSEPGSWSARLRSIDPKLTSTIFFVNSLALFFGLWLSAGVRAVESLRWPNVTTAIGLVEAPIAWLFASRSVAPAVLKDPSNFCPYDLVPLSPTFVVGGCLLILALILVLCGRYALSLIPLTDNRAATWSLSRGLFRSASVCVLLSALLLALCLV